jgi:membrane protein required for colicin V production
LRTLDLILLIPLLIGAYSGYKRGLIMELIGVIALVIAVLGAFKLLHTGIQFLSEYIPEYSNFIPFIAFIGIFIGILILVNLIGRMTKKFLDLTILGVFDNFTGAIIGIFKWAFLVSIVLWLSLQVNLTIPDHLTENSLIYPYIVAFAPSVGNYISAIFPFASDLFESIKDLFN